MSTRILLADDHRWVRDDLAALLSAEGGLEVIAEACDGPTTITTAQACQPDVVILDVHMPGATGVSVARDLAALLPNVPVLAISLSGDPMIVAAMVNAGVRGYVLKDDAHAHLAQAVRAVVAGQRYFSTGLSVVDRARNETRA